MYGVVNGYHGINGTFDYGFPQNKPVKVYGGTEVCYGVYHEAVMIAARGAEHALLELP